VAQRFTKVWPPTTSNRSGPALLAKRLARGGELHPIDVTAFEDLNSEKFLAELISGSKQAFDRLAGDLFQPLWRFLVSKMDVPEADAEELVQDVLMKVHSHLGTSHFCE